jgi:hypothetical protein
MIGALSGLGGMTAQTSIPAGGPKQAARSEQASAQPNAAKNTSNPSGLTDEQERVVQKLKQREAEVRAHEQAHQMAGGGLAGSPSYTTTQGPDGRRYITGGEVSIDVSAEDRPDATIRKMDQVKRAALAPTDPSSQDRAVAAQAEAIKAQAEADLNRQRQEKLKDGEGGAQAGLTADQSSSSNESKALPKGPYNQAAKAYQTAASVIGAIQGVGVSA